MTDGKTYAINKHLDVALQELTAELEQAEARIEKLEGMLARAVDVLLESVEPSELEQAEAETAMLINRLEELEAKLAKALEALGRISSGEFSGQVLTSMPPQDAAAFFARTTLAELKGQDDE